MDVYIRDYNFDQVDTKVVSDINQADNLFVCFELGSFKLYHNNIRSISKNLDETKVYISQFNFQFDCIVFTETYGIPDTSLFLVDGYDLLYNEGDFNRNDGVVVYIRSSLSYNHKIVAVGSIVSGHRCPILS